MIKKVGILGLGETGLAMVRWAAQAGLSYWVADTRLAPPLLKDLKALYPAADWRLGPFKVTDFEGCDQLWVSPGISVKEPAIQSFMAKGGEVVGDIELLARYLNAKATLASPRPKIVAITGSNGKTTVTSLVGEMGIAAGWDTIVAGNISPSVLEAAMQASQENRNPALWVLELSSFQLETTSSLAPDAAVILNVSEDHLDRYENLEEYIEAKERIFLDAQAAIVNLDSPLEKVPATPTLISYGLSVPQEKGFGLREKEGQQWLAWGQQLLMSGSDLQLAGRHNVSNVLAAFALGHAIGLPFDAMVSAAQTFKGLPHRVEWVCEIEGVHFYDDSKGTNVGATEAALKGAERPVVLIAGGDGKGQDFSPLRAAIEKQARAVILIGRDGPKIEKTLAGIPVSVTSANTLEEAVEQAYAVSEPGDMVLLSPACASFDMFNGYAHRAAVFIEAARRLKTKIENGV